MSDRTPCIGKAAGCGRTFKREKFPDGVICSKCMKKVPADVRARFKEGWKKYRKYYRQWQKRQQQFGPESRQARVAARLADAAGNQIKTAFAEMKQWFVEPDRPEGIDEFLKEMGLDE